MQHVKTKKFNRLLPFLCFRRCWCYVSHPQANWRISIRRRLVSDQRRKAAGYHYIAKPKKRLSKIETMQNKYINSIAVGRRPHGSCPKTYLKSVTMPFILTTDPDSVKLHTHT